MNLRIKVLRNPLSYAYKRNPNAGPAWDNNDANNSLDTFALYDGDDPLLACKAQTVANLVGINVAVHDVDTLAPGRFYLRAFVDPRLYKCRPHGIVGAMTLAGDKIGDDSTTPMNKLRWLLHDWRNYTGKVTRVAWSAGCIVLSVADLDRLNAVLAKHGIKPGDQIPAELEEEA